MTHQRNRRRRLILAVSPLEARQLMSADVLTYHTDNARDGANTAETTLTPSNVNSANFGKVGFLDVDGKVDAQPLVLTGVGTAQGVRDIVYVATENDSVYAFDATSGALIWHDGPSTLIPGETPVPAADVNCTQVEPTLGITSTPVIDVQYGSIYVVAMSKSVINGQTTYHQRIHRLNFADGSDKTPPVAIDQSISVPGKGPGGNGSTVSFDPKMYEERDALTLVNGIIYTAWASHCDNPPYTGWVIGFRAQDLGREGVININPNGTPASANGVGASGGSFWNSGGGFAADSSGNLYNISGNGPFDPTQGDYGDSYLKLATRSDSIGLVQLRVADYFTPSNQQTLSNQDIDLGSSGVTLLPDMVDASGATRHLMVGSGKDGNIYLLDRDNLGKFNASNNAIVQEVSNGVGSSEFGTPAYFNGTIYFGGINTNLRAFSIKDGVVSTAPTSQSPDTFGYPGSTVAISANGTTGGIVWAAENGPTAALHAYDSSNLSRELYNSNQAANNRDQFGAGNKFITPTVANGKVYVGTTDGVVVFGLLPAATPTPTPPVVTPPIIPSPAPPPPTVLVKAFGYPAFYVGGFNELGAVGADPAVGESRLTYTWSVVSAPPGAPTPTFSQNGTNASKVVGVGIAASGLYDFRVTIKAPDGQAVTSDVSISAALPAPIFAAPAFTGANRTTGTPLFLGALATDPAFPESALTYTWSTVSTPARVQSPRFAINGTNQSKLTTVTLIKPGTYVFQVRATNPFGQSVTSEVSVLVATPSRAKRR